MVLRNAFTKNLSLKIIIQIAIISYLVVAIFSFFMNSIELNYYSLDSMTIDTFLYQIPIFIVTFMTLVMLNVLLSKELLSQIICVLLLIYFLIFSISSPASSLTVGVFIFSLPVLFYTISGLIKHRYNLFNSKILLYLSTLLEISLIISMIVKFFKPYTFNGQLVSHISDNPIIEADGFYFVFFGVIFTLFVLLIYFNLNRNNDETNTNKKKLKTLMIGLVLFQVGFYILILITKIKSLTSGTFDFGLFTQMFYNMRNGNGMVTTLERSYSMNHLAVHISPIYYLLLPIFYVFPFPETLNILQVLIVTTGIIPVYLIAKEFKFSNKLIALVILMYVFNPAIIGSGFYDLHENCFLSPLLLFVLYFLIKGKSIQLLIFVVLTLLVKEDASIYISTIGIFGLFTLVKKEDVFRWKKLFTCIGLIVIPLIYFIVASSLLNDYGEGAMFWRYSNLNAYSNLGVLGVVISSIQNPSYLLATMFSPVKVYYLIFMILTLGGLPLLSKKIEYYILAIPLLILNFLSSYIYQPVFGYQYYFGTTVLILFLVLLVLRDRINEEPSRLYVSKNYNNFFKISMLLIFAIGTSFMFKKTYYIPKYYLHKNEYDETREFLQSIPEDKKILSNGYLTTYLANREVLYDYRYIDLDETEIIFDFVVLDNRINISVLESYKLDIESRGFILDTSKSREIILVYYNPNTISE